MSGAPLPTHEQQSEEIRRAWIMAANAALNEFNLVNTPPRLSKPAPLITLMNGVTIAPHHLRSVGPVVPYRGGFAFVFYTADEERRTLVERKAAQVDEHTPPDAEALKEAQAVVEAERARLIAAWEAWLAARA